MLYLDAETGLNPGHVWQTCGSSVTTLSFHSNANKTNCKMKSSALTLAFEMRFKATRNGLFPTASGLFQGSPLKSCALEPTLAAWVSAHVHVFFSLRNHDSLRLARFLR